MFWRKKTVEEERAATLIPLLKEKDVSKRLSIIPQLMEQVPASPKILSVLLKDRDPRVRMSAAFTVSSMIATSPTLRQEQVRIAADLLEHGDFLVSMYAASVLGRVAEKFPDFLRNLVPGIVTFPKELSMQGMAHALAAGEIGFRAPEVIETVIPLIDQSLEGKGPARDYAIIAFGRISCRSPLLLKDFVPQIISYMKETKDQSTGLDAALILARISASSPEVSRQLIWPHVEGLLKEKNDVTRAAVALLMGELGLRNPEIALDILPKLTDLLKDENPMVRVLMALSLGRMSTRSQILAEKVVPELLKMRDDPDLGNRICVFASLRYVAATSPQLIREALPDISKMLKDQNPNVRKAAAVGLKLVSFVLPDLMSEITDKIAEQIDEGAEALKQGPLVVRKGVAMTFHMISRCFDPEVDGGLLPEMVALLDDTEPKIRERGLLAIKNIATGYPDLVRVWLPQLVRLLDDKQPIVRRGAALALAEIGVTYPDLVREAAVLKLVEMLEDRELAVSVYIAFSLGQLM